MATNQKMIDCSIANTKSRSCVDRMMGLRSKDAQVRDSCSMLWTSILSVPVPATPQRVVRNILNKEELEKPSNQSKANKE